MNNLDQRTNDLQTNFDAKMGDSWRHFEEKGQMIMDDSRNSIDNMRQQLDEKDSYLMNELVAKTDAIYQHFQEENRRIEENLNMKMDDMRMQFDDRINTNYDNQNQNINSVSQ